MELRELYKKIGLQKEIVQKLEDIEESLCLEELGGCLEQLTDMGTASLAYERLQEYLQEDGENLKMLYCQMECAGRAHGRYEQRRIPEDVYIDTMKCFPRFLRECAAKNGRMFFDRGWWTYRQLSLDLFRVGALEYQISEQRTSGTIGIHIPSDADLSGESVDDSLRRAGVFFRTYFPELKYDRYACDSWLLSPALKNLLPESSHIRSFQERFRILEVDQEDSGYMEWLFRAPREAEYGGLPGKTSLQRNVRGHLLQGGTVGSAYGVMKADLAAIES